METGFALGSCKRKARKNAEVEKKETICEVKMDIKFEDTCNLCGVKFSDHKGYFTTAFRKGAILIGLFELKGDPAKWNKEAEMIKNSGFSEVPICSNCLRLNY